jgi:DNA-binding NtrC family response regulator
LYGSIVGTSLIRGVEQMKNDQIVLVADDDLYICNVIKRSLEEKNIPVRTVNSGKALIRELASNKSKYRAIITDIYMAELSGLQALPIINELAPDLPVIVVTGDPSVELERRIRSFGVFYYMMKPFNTEELCEAVRAALKNGAKKEKRSAK